ncbi:unnamed protein product, partial [Allacma fusca]
MIQDLEILDSLLKKGYDRRATPTNHYNSTSPTTAYVSIIVSSISSPSPMSMVSVDSFPTVISLITVDSLMQSTFASKYDSSLGDAIIADL